MLERIRKALADYQIVLRPDENKEEWWAGAPSVVKAKDRYCLAARMREGDSPRGLRGYEVRILESDDGVNFEAVYQLTRDAMGVNGFERPALTINPKTGKFRLYTCSPFEEGWGIAVLEEFDEFSKIEPRSWKKVLVIDEKPENEQFARLQGFKDPHIFVHNGYWHMVVIGYDRVERPYYFISDDGYAWEPGHNGPFIPSVGWHNFFTRPACVLPLPVGFLVVYEGSSLDWRDPVYNISTGLAYSPDLAEFHDLTPETPLLRSTTPGKYHTWRYSHWLTDGDVVRVFFEASCADNTNEIRVATIPRNDLAPA